MCKAIDRGMVVTDLRLLRKSGGKSGELGGAAVISVEEALARLLAPLEALPPEQVSLADGLGRVLAEDVAARRTQPPFAVSAMDGYAVRAADVAQRPGRAADRRRDPGRRRVWRACSAPARRRASSPARRCPAGADTIVIQEDTERDGDRVRCARARRAAAMSAAPGSISPRATCCCDAGPAADARATSASPRR